MPSVAEIKSKRIVVATLSTARALPLKELPKGHFTHIFIDEAAQVNVGVETVVDRSGEGGVV